jgi:hypothetical protein
MRPSDAGAGAVWRKSVRSGSNYGCVETARLSAERIGVRDSKDVAASPVLSFSSNAWRSFVGEVKAGSLDVD